ncbi:hypothetical protein [Yersinia mollaretii]|uniref:hypothetical protein n=1 Tax=Yersinia mollaretii TaxID=33060 RepID=UPI0011A41C33|nr:hypothetical protein [Yersinia mollaretii]
MNNDLFKLSSQMYAESEARRISTERVEKIMEIQKRSYDNANQYTNLIIVAGFTVFYTTWISTYKELTPWLVWLSIASMFISTCLFVSFEIYKLAIQHKAMRLSQELIKAASDYTNLKTYDDALLKVKKEELVISNSMMRVWIIIFPLTLISSVIGSLLLLACFIIKIISMPWAEILLA